MSCCDTGVSASMSLEVECVVESFATRCTQITFNVTVALDVTVE